MRKLSTAIAFLAIGAVAGAQTLDPNSVNCKRFDDGTAENSWKVANPTGSGDFFNLDLNNGCAGSVAIGICVDTNVTGPGASDGRVGLYPDSAADGSGNTPDLNAALAELVAPTGGHTSGGCVGGTTVFDTADHTLSTSAHIGYVQQTGDSSLWLCGDTTSVNGNSYFTSSLYSSPAIPFGVNWMMGIAGKIQGGTLLVNGGNSACILETAGGQIDFQSGCAGNPGLIGLLCVQVVGFPPIYFPLIFADNNGNASLPIPGLCYNLPFYPVVLILQVIYLDKCDLAPNGKPKIKLSNTVQLTIKEDPVCSSGKTCFGTRDDGVLDSTIWKVQNPAGSRDWFNVRHGGREGSDSCTATSIEIASWDFCGATQSWARVGLYPASGADPTGGTPDTANPVSEVGGGSATMAPNASDWSFPATSYDIADVHLATTTYHVGAQWATGDTCVWLGSDTTGTNDDAGANCASVPGSTSYFTADGYATNAVPFSAANWMMRINWQ